MRGARLLAVAVLGLVPVAAPPAPAPAATSQPCVGVVVDARLLGGDVRTGCAKGDPDSGFEALRMAGFGYAFVPRQPGLVCQIDGGPECSRTTTTTYWSYWYREKGSSRWIYSTAGAGTHDPAPGSTEAWVWQDGGRRKPPDLELTSICPQLSRPRPARSPGSGTSPTPDRSREAPTSGENDRRGRTGSRPPETPQPGAATQRRRKAASTGLPSSAQTPPTTSPGTDPASASPPPGSTGAAPSSSAGQAQEDGAPAWAGLAVGGGLVTALGAAALARSRRAGGSP